MSGAEARARVESAGTLIAGVGRPTGERLHGDWQYHLWLRDPALPEATSLAPTDPGRP